MPIIVYDIKEMGKSQCVVSGPRHITACDIRVTGASQRVVLFAQVVYNVY